MSIIRNIRARGQEEYISVHLQASEDAALWYDEDPRGFTAVFEQYHREVPPTAHLGGREALDFAAWHRLQQSAQ